jgi:hypothetical protein
MSVHSPPLAGGFLPEHLERLHGWKDQYAKTGCVQSREYANYPQRITTNNHATQMVTAPHIAASLKPSHIKLTNALMINPIYSRSPRVVEIGKNPLRFTEGHLTLITVMTNSIVNTARKKIAVGVVHAIHSNSIVHRS